MAGGSSSTAGAAAARAAAAAAGATLGKRVRRGSKGPTEALELVLTLEELFSGCTKHLTVLEGPGGSPDPRPHHPRPRACPCSRGAPAPHALTVPIAITPGLRAGTQLTISAAGCGGGPGVTVVIKEALHSVYRRVGDDLLAIVLVPLLVALTGGRVALRRLDGRPLEITLPEDAVAQPGQVISFRGEGMPCSSDPSRRGNLHVRLQIDFPTSLASLSDAQRERLRQALSS